MLSKRNSFSLTLLLMVGDKKKKVAFRGFVLSSLGTKPCLIACTGQAPHWASVLMKGRGNVCVSLGLALDSEKGVQAGRSQTCLPCHPVSAVPSGKATVHLNRVHWKTLLKTPRRSPLPGIPRCIYQKAIYWVWTVILVSPGLKGWESQDDVSRLSIRSMTLRNKSDFPLLEREEPCSCFS